MVKVDKEKCIGCGACVAIAPETFEFDENGLSKVIDGAAPSEAATEAIGSCPVGAIVEAAATAEGETIIEAAASAENKKKKIVNFPKQPAKEENDKAA